MHALVANRSANGTLEFDPRYPDPLPAANEALLRVRLAGICSTDLEIVKGYMSFAGVPGHEFVATVVGGAAHLVGRRVVGEINCVLPDSDARTESARKHAWPRRVLGILGRDGAFADYLAMPAENLHVLPDSVSDRAAVFVEPLAAAVQITVDHEIHPSMRVAVLGSGRLGVLCAQVLALRGCGLEVVGRNAASLALCASLGLRTVNAQAWTGAAAYDLIVECTGAADGLRLALSRIRPRGTIVLKSTYAEPPRIDLAPIVIHEITLAGNRCGPFAPAIELLAQKRIQVEPLIRAEFPLSKGVEAFALACAPGSMKVLLRPGDAK